VDGAVVLLVDINTLAQTQDTFRKRVEELAASDRHRNEFLAVLARTSCVTRSRHFAMQCKS
jgi:hypothetical protein